MITKLTTKKHKLDWKEVNAEADKKVITFILISLIASVLFAFIAYAITLHVKPQGEVAAFILRDVNVMFISVNATLIGLYVAGFIFLNDSLKTRVKDDPTLRNAVSDIMETYRKIMLIVAFSTAASIVVGVIDNMFVGQIINRAEGSADYENASIAFNNFWWWMFLFSSFFSFCIMAVIIYCSSKITNSDKLIVDQSKQEWSRYYKKIDITLEHYKKQEENEEGKIKSDNALAIFQAIKADLTPPPQEEPNKQTGKTCGYSLALVYQDVLKQQEAGQKIGDRRIQFSKLVRAIELIVTRICDNNIDKSIQNNELLTDSMKEGFIWLYVEGQSKTNIDVRDENRFFDYVKYKIINAEYWKGKAFDNKKAEEIFAEVKQIYYTAGVVGAASSSGIKNKRDIIKNYKDSMKKLIEDFFYGYSLVTSFRNAIEHYYTVANEKQKGDIDKALNVVIPYAETLKRVLMDRFTSFVKTDDINLGNTMMPTAWFNYSELSDSNFTHSSFNRAHIENAIMRNCDLSISSLISVDASGTDFSGSNFNFSNLTGIDLQNAILDGSQLNSILLRDSKMDDFNGWEERLFLTTSSLRIISGRKEQECCWAHDKHEEIEQEIKQHRAWRNKQKEGGEAMRFADTARTVIRDIKPYAQTNEVLKELWLNEDGEILARKEERTLLGDQTTRAANVLQAAYEEINGRLENNIKAHKYRKLSRGLYDCIKDARNYESNWGFVVGEDQEPVPAKLSRESTFGEIIFDVAVLDSASIEKAPMRRIDFSYVSMCATSFKCSDLTGAEMYYTNAMAADFSRTNLNMLDAYRADFSEGGFSNAKLINSYFLDCDLSNANFSKAIMLRTAIVASQEDMDVRKPYLLRFLQKEETPPSNTGVSNYEAATSTEVLADGTYRHVTALETDTKGLCVDSNFSDIMANELLCININANRTLFKNAVLKKGVFFNCMMRWSTFDNADMSNCICIGNSYHQTSFAKVTFSRAAFSACEFSNADLTGADLISCQFNNVIFEEASLRGCNLAGSRVNGGVFRKCAMQGVNLTGAIFKNVSFMDIDFSEAVGLADAKFENCRFSWKEVEVSEQYCLSEKKEEGEMYVNQSGGDMQTGRVYSSGEQ